MTEDGDRSQHGSAADAVELLKREVGASTDSELASLLGLQRSAVAQWRRRSKVPEKAKLKAEFLARSSLSERDAKERAASLSSDVLIYGRALALSVTAPTTGPYSSQPEFEGLWFRRAALTFERSATAAAELLAAAMADSGEAAWTVYKGLLSRPDLRAEIAAKAGTSFAAIDV